MTSPTATSNTPQPSCACAIRASDLNTVRKWAQTLPPGASILDLGCGHGVPISQSLIEAGFTVYGMDASPTLIAAFRARFPKVVVECAAAEDSRFFNRTFDAVAACGLLFLLPAGAQATVIRKVAGALPTGGRFLFTAPQPAVTWSDALTGRQSVSLGAPAYQQILRAEALILTGEASDEGDNHYYFAEKV